MVKEIEYDIYVHMVGTVWAESEDNVDLIDAIFPEGYEGEIDGISISPHFLPEGYIRAYDIEE